MGFINWIAEGRRARGESWVIRGLRGRSEVWDVWTEGGATGGDVGSEIEDEAEEGGVCSEN